MSRTPGESTNKSGEMRKRVVLSIDHMLKIL